MSICELDRFLSPTRVVGRVDCFNTDHYRVVVVFHLSQVLKLKQRRIDHTHVLRELLLKAWREFVSTRVRIVRVSIETISRDWLVMNSLL